MKRLLYPLAVALVWWRSRKPPYHLQRWICIRTGETGYVLRDTAGNMTFRSYVGTARTQFGWDDSARCWLRSREILLLNPGELE